MDSGSNKRKLTRTPHKTQVFFGKNGTPYMGFIKNMSAGGLAIAAKTVFKPGDYLNLLIKNKSEDIYMSGQVRWTNRTIRDLAVDAVFDMGVQFTEYSLNYDELLTEVEKEFKEKRRETRFEKVYRVKFTSPSELMQAYTENISMGGMFIHTEEKLEKGSIVDLEIILADVNDSIKVEARVVFVADKAVSERIGRGPGLGVEIVRYKDDGKARFQEYLGRWMVSDK
jgi:uncharacterized protein (TIGR02266 family)